MARVKFSHPTQILAIETVPHAANNEEMNIYLRCLYALLPQYDVGKHRWL